MANAHPCLIAVLPPRLQALAAHITLSDILSLVQHYGGTRLHIPEKPLSNALGEVISQDSYRYLCQQYGGTYLNVPRCPKLRHALVFHLRDDLHWPFARIARELKITEYWAQKVYRDSPLRQAEQQLPLFH